MSAALAPDFVDLRRREYSRLDASGQVYLDYTGACLYPESLPKRHIALLSTGTFGNPHSANPTSLQSTSMVEEARSAVLRFFNADPAEYEVVFALNATGALKLVGESFPFGPRIPYALTYDNHNSVNGIREFARRRGAGFRYVPLTDPELRIDVGAMRAILDSKDRDGGLLAFPAQSNFSGVQHDLSWIETAQEHGWRVLLDAAAFVPTNQLDLSVHHPDFVPISFYKMFGYPTGVGCLIARKQAAGELVRPWFSGGTVVLARACHTPCPSELGFEGAADWAGFEDGTVNFLTIPAVNYGLEYLQRIGIHAVHDHVMLLTEELLSGLSYLTHRNGRPLVHMYGPETVDRRGGTVAMNLFDARGKLIHPRRVEEEAGTFKISVRTGCHCNPGAGQVALQIPDEEFEQLFRAKAGMSRERFQMVASSLREGAVRVSLGIASNRDDVQAFLTLVERFLDRTSQSDG